MTYFAVNLLLALVWAALIGLSFGQFLLGFVIGFGVLFLTRPFLRTSSYVSAMLAAVHLTISFLGDLTRSNVRLARDVLRREPAFSPAFVRVDIPGLGAGGAALLAALVSLTPGSITVDLNDTGDVLYLHTVYAPDLQAVRQSVSTFADLIRRAGGGATEGRR